MQEMQKLNSQCLSMHVGVAAYRSDFKPDGKTQIIHPKHIDAGGNLRFPLDRVDIKRDFHKNTFVCDDDVLLKARGAQFSATHIKQAPANTVAGSVYFILRARREVVLPAFLAWFLNNTRLPIVGSVIPSINLKDLREMPVAFPSLATQEKIAHAHALAEEARALFEQYRHKVNEQIKAFALESTKKERQPAV